MFFDLWCLFVTTCRYLFGLPMAQKNAYELGKKIMEDATKFLPPAAIFGFEVSHSSQMGQKRQQQEGFKQHQRKHKQDMCKCSSSSSSSGTARKPAAGENTRQAA
jgi:hypothetical protein